MKTTGDLVTVDSVDDQNGTSGNGQNITNGKEFGQKTLRSLKRGLGRLWRRHRGNASITDYDPCYKVSYLGNVLTGWAKGEGCVEKPVSTLWRNYVGSSRPDVSMRLTVTNGGLTATTKDHGLTEYWAHRVTYCTAPASHPRLFVWVYRHEGRRLRPELRCHAALCSRESTAKILASTLNARLQQALLEFRRDKVSRQNARLSLANSLYENPSLPRRKILLSTGGQNYRPPLERSKSAPKLSAIEEDAAAEEIEQQRLLEELRSLENVTCNWHDQDGWKLARLLDALNRESSDENGSISSGCETASTATSEERAPGPEDQPVSGETEQHRSTKRVFFSDEVPRIGLRRNSDGSPNFLSCAGSPRFNRRGVMDRENERPRFRSRSNEEDEYEEEGLDEDNGCSNVFDFEDVEDFEQIVDYRPRGEALRRIENPDQDSNKPNRRRSLPEKYPHRMSHEILQTDICENFLTLDSLDEEEADSDESGYVEAPPKSLFLEKDENEKLKLKKEDPTIQDNPVLNYDENNDGCQNEKDPLIHDENQRVKEKERERVDSIRCPISETIKKLANASIAKASSKSLELSSNGCCSLLKNLKAPKSLDKEDLIQGESPSLHQRKQLLAQQGVIV